MEGKNYAKGTKIKELALITLICIPIYILLDIIVQLLPPHYSIKLAESLLADGPYGYIMNINFLIRGMLSISVIIALSQYVKNSIPSASFKIGRVMFWVWGIAAFLLAIFNCDTSATATTLHGKIHFFLGVVAFIAAPIGMLLISISIRNVAQLKSIKIVTLVVSILDICVFLILFSKHNWLTLSYPGIVERVGIGLVLLWSGIIAFKLKSFEN